MIINIILLAEGATTHNRLRAALTDWLLAAECRCRWHERRVCSLVGSST